MVFIDELTAARVESFIRFIMADAVSKKTPYEDVMVRIRDAQELPTVEEKMHACMILGYMIGNAAARSGDSNDSGE